MSSSPAPGAPEPQHRFSREPAPRPLPLEGDAHLGEQQLTRGLKTRHLTMMGLGSAIGAGLFLGTGVGIRLAGPAVLVSFLLAGLIVVLVMRMLGELGSAMPASGSFSYFAELAFGPVAGFVMGWLYWFLLILVLGAEMTGASMIMGSWFNCPPWIPALVCMVFFTCVNLVNVRQFGEFEFWFAAIKVTVIIAFLAIGILLATGLWPGSQPVGFQNFLGDGGFMPFGWKGVSAGLLAVAFAFGGIEIVTIAAAESENPEKSISMAVRSVIWRIGIFYLGSILVITFLLPWRSVSTDSDVAQSPFAMVLGQTHMPAVVGFMEVIIVLSLLSAFNAQLYASSRMIYSLAKNDNAPKRFARLDSHGVPLTAMLLSVFFGFVSVALNYFEVEGLLTLLLQAVGSFLIIIWTGVALSELRLRPRLEAEGKLRLRMWCFPYLTWFTLALIVGLVLLMLADPNNRTNVMTTLSTTAFLALIGFLRRRWINSHATTS